MHNCVFTKIMAKFKQNSLQNNFFLKKNWCNCTHSPLHTFATEYNMDKVTYLQICMNRKQIYMLYITNQNNICADGQNLVIFLNNILQKKNCNIIWKVNFVRVALTLVFL